MATLHLLRIECPECKRVERVPIGDALYEHHKTLVAMGATNVHIDAQSVSREQLCVHCREERAQMDAYYNRVV
jgi:hypothetical protein